MGLLDSVIGAIGGGAATGNTGALGGGLAGGGRGALISLLLGMLMNRGQGGGAGGGLGGVLGNLGGGGTGPAGVGAGGLGGLGDLIGRFQHGGLGDVVGSWIGSGQNLPVSPGQVHQVLGDDIVSQIAQHLGVSHGEAASQLSDVLPEVVDTMTPGGQLPADGHFGDIGEILGRFGKS